MSTHVTHGIPKPEISHSLTRAPTAAHTPSNHTFARRGSFHVPTEQTYWFFRDEACTSSSQVVTEARRQPGLLNNRHEERCRTTANHYAQRTTSEGYHHPKFQENPTRVQKLRGECEPCFPTDQGSEGKTERGTSRPPHHHNPQHHSKAPPYVCVPFVVGVVHSYVSYRVPCTFSNGAAPGSLVRCLPVCSSPRSRSRRLRVGGCSPCTVMRDKVLPRAPPINWGFASRINDVRSPIFHS